jgi:hypothetical protein
MFVVGGIMVPKHVQILIFETCECAVTKQMKITVAVGLRLLSVDFEMGTLPMV